MRATLKLLACTAVASLLSGCASLIADHVQELRVKLTCRSKPVAVTCTARNNLGSWRFISPGTVQVKTDASMLEINCKGQYVPEFTVCHPCRLGRWRATCWWAAFWVLRLIPTTARAFDTQKT